MPRTKEEARRGIGFGGYGYGRRSYDYEDHEGSAESESDENSNGSSDTSVGEPKKKKAKREEPEDTTTVKHKVNEILKTVSSGGSAYEFAISQKLTQAPMVVISLQDGNILRFPIYEQEIDRILDLFEKSPYGKGSETILDTSFRNSYQMSPDKFTILNPSWDNFIKETLVPLVAKELSISDPFMASIYKLLMYKQGSFFKLHRDSEKEQGMFATLIVQLPSKYTGGELLVHHDGQIKTIDFSTGAAPEAEFSTCFSVFYCDCLHEINPLKSGVRACLVYNLCLTGKNPKPMIAPRSSEPEDRLGTIFENWKELRKTRDGPSKIVYALKHKYTRKNLSFENLKSTDKAIAQLLKAVTTQHQMTLLLAIFEKTSKGDENGDSEFDSDDSDCYCKNEYELTHLRQLDSSDSAKKFLNNMKPISVELKEEVIPENCWSVIKPYDTEREETGNEGVHLTLFYRHAAFVIWPTDLFEIFVHGRGNIDKAENIFLREYKNTRGVSRDEVIDAKLLKWAWDLVNNYSGFSRESENAFQLLSAIADFNNLELLKKFLQHRNSLTRAKIPILIAQCEKYGWNALSTEILKMFEQQEYERDTALEMLKLFITTTTTGGEEKRNVCAALAQHVLKTVKSSGYPRYGNITPEILARRTLHNESEKKFLMEFYNITRGIEFNMIQVAEKKPLDIIVSLLLELGVDKKEILRKSWIEMTQIVLKRMEKIIAKSLPVPIYRRDDFHSSCVCNDCELLLRFMQSNTISKGFKMTKIRRLHLEKAINNMQNVSHVTERDGTPHTLIITKTEKTGTEDHWEKKIAVKQMSELKKLLEEK